MSVQRAKHSHARKATRPVLYSEQSCFEADRSAVVRELTTVENAIEEDACEMAMIAAEGVFDQRVSRILTGEARAMHRMVRGLKDLRLAVARARRPES